MTDYHRPPDGDYLLISIPHEISGVLVHEQGGQIRVPFEGERSVLLAIASMTITYEKRGPVVTGEVICDG
jgi:hypothetical protein